jgi:hypothetical protein
VTSRIRREPPLEATRAEILESDLGWALLGRQPDHRMSHRILAYSSCGSKGWVRYATACRRSITGRGVELGSAPDPVEPVCPDCGRRK